MTFFEDINPTLPFYRKDSKIDTHQESFKLRDSISGRFFLMHKNVSDNIQNKHFLRYVDRRSFLFLYCSEEICFSEYDLG